MCIRDSLYILCLLFQFFCGFLLSLFHFHHLWDSMYPVSYTHLHSAQADSVMEEIRYFIEESTEAEITDMEREIF